MSKDNPSIPERITAVEVELKHVKVDLRDLKDDFNKCSAETHKKIGLYNDKLSDLTLVVETKLRGSLSGREKASIYIALITSVTSFLIVLVQAVL